MKWTGIHRKLCTFRQNYAYIQGSWIDSLVFLGVHDFITRKECAHSFIAFWFDLGLHKSVLLSDGGIGVDVHERSSVENFGPNFVCQFVFGRAKTWFAEQTPNATANAGLVLYLVCKIDAAKRSWWLPQPRSWVIKR